MEPKDQRDQRIGPDGGPPDDRERQWRGSTPTEDVMEEVMREGAAASRPPGTGTDGELAEPDAGMPHTPEQTE